ncbi:hypothetical protein BDZ94DRAFT_1262974 [Collybia nuda]|uniref:Uncharacterized protein n=1 Tax=Collybia nuda TaxID=64659 RepID=A0A9P5Y1W6_9AGAR|nr:hypothetical protein BDZ94DRAFT_1262974 [Collybia nuda]
MTAELKLSEDIRNQTYAERVQNGILSLLFDVAPKSLLVSSVTLGSLDLNNLTLENPIVQRSLVEFFSKLSSNTFVKKAILGVVDITTELKLSGSIENGIRYQTHSEKVQNTVLSLLFDIAPKTLLISNLTTSSLDVNSLTLDHPIVQRGLVDFFTKLASNKFVKTAIYGAVNFTAEVKLSGGVENGIRNQAYTEKVQNAILSLLLNIAPKHLLAPNVTPTGVYGTLHGALDLNNITLDHPVVQRGLVDFFTKLSSNKFVKKAIFGAVNVTAELKLSEDIRNQTHAEKVQNGILYLLFNIAPKSLLVPNVATNGASSTLYAALDPNNLTLDHPVVQRGLTDFFTKLTSNQIVKKAILGAVNITAELGVSGDIKNGIRDQTYAEKVQNGILSLLLGIAPKTLLAPNVVSSGALNLDSLTLDHPIVQRGLAEFFTKLASNQFVRKAILGAVNITAESKLSGNTEIGIQTQTYAEKVQDRIFSLLFNIAPKHLLTPNLTALGISGTLHAALDLNNLSLENSIVQRGLLDFFTRLASNAFVRKAILVAVDVTAELEQPKVAENGSFGLDVDTISGHQLARLVSLILADRGFNDGVSAMSLGKVHKAEEYTITVARKGEYV